MPGVDLPNGSGGGVLSEARVLVIGSGFIGSQVVLELARRGRPPVVLTRSMPAEEVAETLEPGDLHLADAADREAVAASLAGVRHVVFAAGGLLPAASEREPRRDAELTLRPLSSTLDALGAAPGVELTYLSSGGTVYGEPDRHPVDERHPLRPIGSYGRLRVACEGLVQEFRRRHGPRARILRCATVYGEHQVPGRGQGAVVTFLDRAARGERIDLFGGDTVRDYIYAGDVARVIVDSLGTSDRAPVLNVGSGKGTSLTELVRMVEAEVGRALRIHAQPQRRFDVHEIFLDVTRLRELLDFEPTPLERGIALTNDWLRAARAVPNPA